MHQNSLVSAPPRLQWMLLQLQGYDVTIKYRPEKEMLLTDALSRCPSQASGEIKLDMRIDNIAFSKTWIAKLKETMRQDPILGTVYQLTQQGWPHQRRHTPRMARVYWDFRDQLSTDEGLLLMGPRIVILSCLCEEYLQRLHQGHLSATKVQQNARQHLYWPGLDANIADYTRRYQECICWSQPPKEPLQAHDVPQESWERIAMDYFYMNGRLYILICHYFSKFPFLFQAKTMSFANLKDHLEELFSVEGIPDEIMSDNGPPFNDKEFSSYLTGLSIRHTTSSPNYPRSNGFIERQIQTMKRLIEKANSSGRSHQEALTGLRAQPLGDGLPSLAEILHRRSLVTRKASPVDLTVIHQFLIVLQAKYKYQEPWQGQASKDSVSTGDRWGSLFPFREEWMANWHCNWYNWHWEKLQYPDRWGYITEEEQVTSQAKVPWYISNFTYLSLQNLNILPKWNNRKPASWTDTPSQSEIFLQ